jgi:hypothetical protein
MPTAVATQLPQPLEPKLYEYLASLGADLSGWHAICLSVSTLKPAARRVYKLKQVADAFQALLNENQGSLFHLANSDLVLIVQAPSEPLSDTVARAVDTLGIAGDHAPLRVFGLSSVRGAPYDACIASAAEPEPEPRPAGRKSSAKKAGAVKPAATAAGGRPVQPSDLVKLETALGRADVAALLRRQTVCQLIEGERPKPVFRELYVSIADLEDKVAPGVKLAADRWLFQHLTRALDARVLTQLVETPDPSLASHISLNLNVASVQSRQFQAFDAKLSPAARRSIVLEIQLIDILSDMGAFQVARDFAHERGYSLCLDGLTYLTAPLTDRALLGLDLVKVIWTPQMVSDEVETRRNAFAWMIDKCGDGRAILCRCDGEDAIKFGQSIGITLFQGMAVDTRAEAAQAVFAAPE